ncbi:Imm1 family immunity protein [Streptomyces sp. NPDC056269]|uniref:Imm1 family immunity protein n=1 Tax=Streptomyces sp. NPDC056269 TaxID=3345768 RepID=UPI0035DD4427
MASGIQSSTRRGRDVESRAEAHYRSEHKSTPDRLQTPEDVDRMIDSLLTGEKFHTLARVVSENRQMLPSGFPDHEFMVGVNADRQMGAITFGCEEGSFSTVSDPESDDEPVYHLAGHDFYFPESCEIPLTLIRDAVKEFIFSGGKRPSCVAWKPVDF